VSFSRYGSYQDSGVDWLGEVPSHWLVRRLKHVADAFPSNIDKKSYDDETPVRLCNYTDVYYADVIVDDPNFMSATATAEQIEKFTLRAGDTIITKDSETADDIASAAYVPADLPGVVCGYHLSMIRPRPGVSGAFIKRYFDSAFTKASVAVRANGLTRVGLGQYAVDNLDIPLPPYAEQLAIAAFLDRETAKIDALVEAQRQLIELLKEKRQAVISHAVTKGLDPTVPMKDSGVEWLGEVPAHWDTLPLRAIANGPACIFIDGDWIESKDLSDAGVRYITTGNVGEGIYKEQGAGFISEETFDALNCTEVLPGDVLIARLNQPIGRACIVPDLSARIASREGLGRMGVAEVMQPHAIEVGRAPY
jgi:type I restriction enzyme, S subunit